MIMKNLDKADFKIINEYHQFYHLMKFTLIKGLLKKLVVLFILVIFTSPSVNAIVKTPNNSPLQLTPLEQKWLLAHPNITVAFDGNFPPYSFLNDKQQLDGVVVNYFDLIEKRISILLKSTVPRFIMFLKGIIIIMTKTSFCN